MAESLPSAENNKLWGTAYNGYLLVGHNTDGTHFGGIFNVKDPAYGAVGDGEADDTAAIVSAIIAANAAGGGTVYFPPGTYNVTGEISILSNVTLFGDNATIFLIANSDTIIFPIVSGSNIIVDGLEIDGNGDNQGSTSNFFNMGGTNDNITIKNCHLHDGKGAAYANVSSATSNMKFIDNWVHDFTSNGISMTGIGTTSNTLISRNTFTDLQKAVSSQHNTDDIAHVGIRITDNYVKDMKITTPGFGFEMGAIDTTDISNNIIDTCFRGVGIGIEGAATVTLSNNTVKGATDVAFEVSSQDVGGSILMEGNIFINCVGGIVTSTQNGINYNITANDNEFANTPSGDTTTEGIRFSAINGTISNNTFHISDADSGEAILIQGGGGVNAQNINCIGNTIFFDATVRTLPPTAIALAGASVVTVSNNICVIGDDSGTSGIIRVSSNDSDHVFIEDNRVIYAGVGIATNPAIKITGTEAEDCSIARNYIEGFAIGINTTGNTSFPVSIKDNVFIGNTANIRADISHQTEATTTLDNTGTPTVSGATICLTGGTATITDFDDGLTNQIITVIAEHSLDITDGTNIFLSGSATWSMTATDTLVLICKADNKWYELSRGDNGA